jgi:transcriptional regulator with GAF, ATPase, and Fis domain
LDEIGSATSETQNRLLRVLEEREIRRLGSSRNIPVDVRVIAATNTDLEKLVQRGVFRADLYYRLCALPIIIPPLRERKTDIRWLVEYFIAQSGMKTMDFSPELIDMFLSYSWPGNIRELKNIVRYLHSVVESGRTTSIADLPPYLLRKLSLQSLEEIALPSFLPFGRETSCDTLSNGPQGDETQKAFIALLTEVGKSASPGRGVGYGTLFSTVNSILPGISKYYVKKWLKVAKCKGYVETGRTKQGTHITEKGRALLRILQQQNGIVHSDKYATEQT